MLKASQGATRTGAALTAVAQVDLRARLAALPVPVGVLWGEHDRIIPASGIETVLQARGPDTPVERIAGAGHIPMMERPEPFAIALEEVLDGAVTASQHRRAPRVVASGLQGFDAAGRLEPTSRHTPRCAPRRRPLARRHRRRPARRCRP